MRTPVNRGFTLIEVLVTLVVMTVGMLAISFLFVESMQLNRNAIHRTTAVALASDMAERVRATAGGPLAERERIEWQRLVRERLPVGASGEVRRVPVPAESAALSRYDIDLQWPEAGRHGFGSASYGLSVTLPDR
jgi:type IV pilus modification protein PilV